MSTIYMKNELAKYQVSSYYSAALARELVNPTKSADSSVGRAVGELYFTI